MPHESRPRVLSADSLEGDTVVNREGEDLGSVKSLMIDLSSGQVAYAVLSFGGVLGMGDKYFAIPWNKLYVDTDQERVVVDVEKERLKDAPGFDKDNWPDMADPDFRSGLDRYYGAVPV